MEDLKAWFSARPKWIQDAARVLLTKGRLAAEDLDALHQMCLDEVDADESKPTTPFLQTHCSG